MFKYDIKVHHVFLDVLEVHIRYTLYAKKLKNSVQ